MNQDYQTLIRTAFRNDSAFVRLTFSKKRQADELPWLKVIIRPVKIRGETSRQFSFFDARRDITKNHSGPAAEAELDKVLAMPFGELNLLTAQERIHVRITEKGRVQIRRSALKEAAEPDLRHDRQKTQPLPAGQADDFLRAIGIAGEQGQIRPAMGAKHHQINAFLRILESALPAIPDGPLRVVDCGCGKAYLSFAAYHFLRHRLNRAVHFAGVDLRPDVIGQCRALGTRLGWNELEFHVARITEYQPTAPPDIVISLHACDTATDEALAQGALWGSKVILAAPCCQHELHRQLRAELFQPVWEHGILRERMADILTDAFRARLLRLLGYKTEVMEFIHPEHTAKNLLIRAIRDDVPPTRHQIQAYMDLKRYWQVTPALEMLLAQRLAPLLANTAVG